MDSPRCICAICRRDSAEWLLRITVEDTAGLSRVALICGNCAIKLRLASEQMRCLQIDSWIHAAVASILCGIEPAAEEESEAPERPPKRNKR